jgi:hypothetical protein
MLDSKLSDEEEFISLLSNSRLNRCTVAKTAALFGKALENKINQLIFTVKTTKNIYFLSVLP